jgi:hypothetical protein
MTNLVVMSPRIWSSSETVAKSTLDGSAPVERNCSASLVSRSALDPDDGICLT